MNDKEWLKRRLPDTSETELKDMLERIGIKVFEAGLSEHDARTQTINEFLEQKK